jgi:hypothetical protein
MRKVQQIDEMASNREKSIEKGKILTYEILAFLLLVPNANRLPILPKHTLLQNNTLAIHVPTPMLSLLIKPSCIP